MSNLYFRVFITSDFNYKGLCLHCKDTCWFCNTQICHDEIIEEVEIKEIAEGEDKEIWR